MGDRLPRVLRFVSAELKQTGKKRYQANVELEHSEHGVFAASADGKSGELDGLPLAVRAAASAILKAVGERGDRMEVVGTTISETFGARSVFVKVVAERRGLRRELVGFCLIDVDPARAAVLALLSATNRFLGLG